MAHSELSASRMVPEGKVYRQVFDAEVSLVRALEQERHPPKPKSPLLPLVKDSKLVTHGLLSSRQKSWAHGMPNESYIENPVYYKYAALEAIERDSKPENYFAAQEVRGLSDFPRQTKSKSNIIEKIQVSRKERHESILEDMYQEFAVINAELEPRIIEASESLKESLLENDKEIERLVNTIADDQDLINYELPDLHSLWEKIAEHSVQRQNWIRDLWDRLQQCEVDRSTLIREALKSYDKQLERTAHLMPPDVHRLLEKEALHINSTICTNRRAYADLIGHLLSADVERERNYYTLWQSRVEDWRQLKCQAAITKFIEFMDSPPIKDPPGVRRKIEEFTIEQRAVNKRRLDLLDTLRKMKPPNSTKSAVYEWHDTLIRLCKELEELSMKYRDIIQAEYDNVIEQCTDEVNRVKEQFLSDGVLEEARLDVILNESLLPLVGEKQTKYEYEVDKMERSLENLTSFQEMMVKSLFKFVQGAAHLWDLHEIGLARKERALQEQLEKNRQDHDGANQVKEANLDIIMDKMRQDSSETALKASLSEALTLLNQIKQMYNEFHGVQVQTACVYPEMVQEELHYYDNEVCKYFQVNRKVPNKSATGKALSASKKSQRTQPQSLDDILTTSNGTSFYILKEPGEHGLPETPESIRSMKTCMTFLTENSESEDVSSPYLESIAIREELFVELRKHVRMEFLEHLEKWEEQAMERANSVVSAKMEELNSELDLRLHLHEPRSSRAEQDVHSVRAAELIMHRERVEKHCKGVTTTLNEFKARFQQMVEEHDKETEVFKQSVQELEATFVSATKTHELLAIQDQVAGRVEQYMDVIRFSIRKFRHDLDEILSTLRNSNARFRKTFKVFSDGGNFSTEEIEEYRKKLERMAGKIDSAEGSFMAELEGMETKRLEAATEYAGKLEDRFKHHLFDLTYMEKITRWLTNTQVKVKSQVAFSNSQAKKLAIYLATFERHLDAVERPNLDKEQVTAREVQASLIPILQSFHERSLFLNALLNPATPSLSVLKAGMKVTFDDKKKEDDSKKQKKTDLKARKSKKKLKSEADSSEDLTKPKTSPASSRATKAAEEDSRPKTVPAELKNNGPKRTSSDIEKLKSAGARKSSVGTRRDQGPRCDKKFLVFGENPEEDRHFLAKIKNVLREGLEGLLATAEMYYKQKGTQRAPTRPQAIQDNFDACAEILVQRLQSYKTQADEYHNSCIQELRGQLQRFGVLLVRLPVLVMNVVVEEHVTELNRQREEKDTSHQQRVKELERRKQHHQSQLRPTLGHPQNRQELDTLCGSETRRKTESIDGIQEHSSALLQSEVEFGGTLVQNLAQTCETMLLQFDAVLTLEDVEVGKVEPTPKSSKRLLREKLAGSEENRDKLSEFPMGSATWEGLPTNALCAEGPDETPIRSPSVKTVKTTAAHIAVIKARDNAFENYKTKFYSRLEEIKNSTSAQLQDEERWDQSWQRSIKKIKDLY
ncbi:coiled-coil domain-containing protein 180 [Nematostella vectensis]|uniref:coiled-coil domain-containing protein 180 n=1 Tax=Nematostella vectensis TaxID=45351 RepID=UPI0020775E1E|nr:coiled-coil domain-containing protein 180 [Nematostella vectensis]